MTPPAHDPQIHHLPKCHVRRWDNYYNCTVLQDDLNALGKLKIPGFPVKALCEVMPSQSCRWFTCQPLLLPLGAPQTPSPPASCVPRLWKRNPPLVPLQPGDEAESYSPRGRASPRTEQGPLAEGVGSGEPAPAERSSMLGSVSEGDGVSLARS